MPAWLFRLSAARFLCRSPAFVRRLSVGKDAHVGEEVSYFGKTYSTAYYRLLQEELIEIVRHYLPPPPVHLPHGTVDPQAVNLPLEDMLYHMGHVRLLRDKLKMVQPVSPPTEKFAGARVVSLLSTVILFSDRTQSWQSWLIVGEEEQDLELGLLSHEHPISRAIMGLKPGLWVPVNLKSQPHEIGPVDLETLSAVEEEAMDLEWFYVDSVYFVDPTATNSKRQIESSPVSPNDLHRLQLAEASADRREFAVLGEMRKRYLAALDDLRHQSLLDPHRKKVFRSLDDFVTHFESLSAKEADDFVQGLVLASAHRPDLAKHQQFLLGDGLRRPVKSKYFGRKIDDLLTSSPVDAVPFDSPVQVSISSLMRTLRGTEYYAVLYTDQEGALKEVAQDLQSHDSAGSASVENLLISMSRETADSLKYNRQKLREILKDKHQQLRETLLGPSDGVESSFEDEGEDKEMPSQATAEEEEEEEEKDAGERGERDSGKHPAYVEETGVDDEVSSRRTAVRPNGLSPPASPRGRDQRMRSAARESGAGRKGGDGDGDVEAAGQLPGHGLTKTAAKRRGRPRKPGVNDSGAE